MRRSKLAPARPCTACVPLPTPPPKVPFTTTTAVPPPIALTCIAAAEPEDVLSKFLPAPTSMLTAPPPSSKTEGTSVPTCSDPAPSLIFKTSPLLISC